MKFGAKINVLFSANTKDSGELWVTSLVTTWTATV